VTFEISVGISFFTLLLFPEHGDIQNVSYTAQRQTDLVVEKIFRLGLWAVAVLHFKYLTPVRNL